MSQCRFCDTAFVSGRPCLTEKQRDKCSEWIALKMAEAAMDDMRDPEVASALRAEHSNQITKREDTNDAALSHADRTPIENKGE